MNITKLDYGDIAANLDSFENEIHEEDKLLNDWVECLLTLSKEQPEYTSISEKILTSFLNIPDGETQYYDSGLITRFGFNWIIQKSEDSNEIIAEVRIGKNADFQIMYKNKKYILDFNHGIISNPIKYSWHQNLWNGAQWQAKIIVDRVNNLIDHTPINIIKITREISNVRKKAQILFEGTSEEMYIDKIDCDYSSVQLESNGNLPLKYCYKEDKNDIEKKKISIDGDRIKVNLDFFGEVQIHPGSPLNISGVSLLDGILKKIGDKKLGQSVSLDKRLINFISEEVQEFE